MGIMLGKTQLYIITIWAQGSTLNRVIWVFSLIWGTILGVLIIRIIIYWDLHWGPPIMGNYHMNFEGWQAFGRIRL